MLQCSVSCGRGHKQRNVYCLAKDGSHLESDYCKHLTKPHAHRRCRGGRCPRWKAGAWSQVSNTSPLPKRSLSVQPHAWHQHVLSHFFCVVLILQTGKNLHLGSLGGLGQVSSVRRALAVPEWYSCEVESHRMIDGRWYKAVLQYLAGGHLGKPSVGCTGMNCCHLTETEAQFTLVILKMLSYDCPGLPHRKNLWEGGRSWNYCVRGYPSIAGKARRYSSWQSVVCESAFWGRSCSHLGRPGSRETGLKVGLICNPQRQLQWPISPVVNFPSQRYHNPLNSTTVCEVRWPCGTIHTNQSNVNLKY